jgi:hypothetical protein
MSKKLKEEQEKFTELYKELKELSENKEKEGEDPLLAGKNLISEYKKQFSLSEIKSFFLDWEADTPEEIETMEICRSVISN